MKSELPNQLLYCYWPQYSTLGNGWNELKIFKICWVFKVLDFNFSNQQTNKMTPQWTYKVENTNKPILPISYKNPQTS